MHCQVPICSLGKNEIYPISTHRGYDKLHLAPGVNHWPMSTCCITIHHHLLFLLLVTQLVVSIHPHFLYCPPLTSPQHLLIRSTASASIHIMPQHSAHHSKSSQHHHHHHHHLYSCVPIPVLVVLTRIGTRRGVARLDFRDYVARHRSTFYIGIGTLTHRTYICVLLRGTLYIHYLHCHVHHVTCMYVNSLPA